MSNLVDTIRQKFLLNIIESEQSIGWDGMIIYRRYLSEDAKAQDNDILRDSELFNSFFADDLFLVERAVHNETFGDIPMEQALLDYITGAYAEEKPELEWFDFSKRIDIYRQWNDGKAQQQSDFFHDHLDIAKAPLGKWPSKFMPCLMQQLAINMSWSPSCDNAPIFSVNGPPGTGKTTLLKEIIAGNLVEHAILLAEYADPDDAFVPQTFQDGYQSSRGYSKFCPKYFTFQDDRLKDYGIMVASCNNAAVENITKELPDGKALLRGLLSTNSEDPMISVGLDEVKSLFSPEDASPELFAEWDDAEGKSVSKYYPDIYFTKLANDLAKKSVGTWDRWGLISAPFGKTSNLKSYIFSVLKPYIKSFSTNSSIASRKESYLEIVQQFKKQLEKVNQIKRELEKVSGARYQFCLQNAAFEKEIAGLENQVLQESSNMSQLQNNIQKLNDQLTQMLQTLSQYRDIHSEVLQKSVKQSDISKATLYEIDALRQKILELEKSRRLLDWLFEIIRKPSLLSRSIQKETLKLQEIEQEHDKQDHLAIQLQQQAIEKSQRCELQHMEIEREHSNRDALCDKRQNCLNQIESLREKIKSCHEEIAAAHAHYKSLINAASSQVSEQAMVVLNDDFFAQCISNAIEQSTSAQVANPWHTESYNREREKLFFESLKLHKAFLLASKHCLWNFKNLLLLWKEPRDDDNKPVAFSERDKQCSFSALLNTVFLLTPVLSTTFASAGTMLSAIRKPGEIGCLIIDEAGQASPQMAIGSLYRSRRAIVVGDPKQVEPVVTDEMDLIKQIIQDDFTSPYQSKTHSVQSFADRLNNVGTNYGEEEKTWVGCPLVVHRRCISPMFDISNALSYDHIMKQQTIKPSPERERTFCRSNSGWINVVGSENNTTGKDHYVMAQGEKAWQLIKKAFVLSEGIPNLFVITPFKTVKNGLKKFILSQPECKNDSRFAEWADQNIGTVHTFQGKEADQVLFLLGCDKNAIPAVRWVNTNIVNVAVTRAKFRLYIIGDYTVWQQSAIFQKVKGILDSYALRALDAIASSPSIPHDEAHVTALLQQTPDSESLTIDGELDDRLADPLFNELHSMWKSRSLTPEQLHKFHLSDSDLKSLIPSIRQRLISSIMLYDMLNKMKSQFHLAEMDAACSSILFCKTMESLLKEVLFGKLKKLLPEATSTKKKLQDLKDSEITTGTFTHILSNQIHRSTLASFQANLYQQPKPIYISSNVTTNGGRSMQMI